MKRVPISESMTLAEVATLAVNEFLHGITDSAVFEVGLEVVEGDKKRLVAVRFQVDTRDVASMDELLPATPRH